MEVAYQFGREEKPAVIETKALIAPPVTPLQFSQRSSGLSPKERQLVGLLLQGYDNHEIAAEMHIAMRTVKAHMNRMFIRFNIRDGFKRVKLALLFCQKKSEIYPTEAILSTRERKICYYVSVGFKNFEIACMLKTTEHVVKNYLRVIYDRLGLSNRVELAVWYYYHVEE